MEENRQQGVVNSYVAIVFDEAQLPKFVHELADPRPCGSDNLGERPLAYFCYDRLWFSLLAEIRDQEKQSRQAFLARIEKLIDQTALRRTKLRGQEALLGTCRTNCTATSIFKQEQLSATGRFNLTANKPERNQQMAMNDPNDDMARRNMDARPRIEERPRMEARPGWVLPAIVGAALIAGFLVFAMSGDRSRTVTNPASETTGRSERAPVPPTLPPGNPNPTTPQTAPEAPRAQ